LYLPQRRRTGAQDLGEPFPVGRVTPGHAAITILQLLALAVAVGKVITAGHVSGVSHRHAVEHRDTRQGRAAPFSTRLIEERQHLPLLHR
jgi:hypothetical protein